jgi:hypothetical protein
MAATKTESSTTAAGSSDDSRTPPRARRASTHRERIGVLFSPSRSDAGGVTPTRAARSSTSRLLDRIDELDEQGDDNSTN